MLEHKKRALLVVHTSTYFTGLEPLAIIFKRSGQVEPVFLFTQYYPTLPDEVETCRKEGFTALFGRGVKDLLDTHVHLQGSYDKKNKPTVHLNKLERTIRLLKTPRLLVEKIFARVLKGSILGEMRELSRSMDDFRAVIRSENISIVILPADNRYDLSAYVKAAHLEHIGVVIVPQFMAGPLEWAEYVWNQSVYQVGRLRNKLASVLYPRWVLTYKGRTLVALPGAQLIAREWLGIAPPLPWVLHSGAADAIALESEAVQDYCLSEGLPPEKMAVTGSVAHDVMFDRLSDMEQKRAKFSRDLGFRENRPIILTAIPQDYLYVGRPECDFQEYKDLLEFWCRSLTSVLKYNCVVALHPSVQYEEMKYIEDFGLKISREPTANVIPLCDIYVACISSTIQWAIACGKPVLNYDVFRYRYTDYQNVRGVITVEEQQDYLHYIKELTDNPDFYALMTSRQSKVSGYWGHLDGKASNRLQNLFASKIK